MTKTFVQFGNANARVGYKPDDTTDAVEYESFEGQTVTRVEFDEDAPLLEMFQTSVAQLTSHIEPGEEPKWVESNNEALQGLLAEHYHCKGKTRPASWGTKALRSSEFLDHPADQPQED